MENTEKLFLNQPKPSPKMDRIFNAIELGFPDASRNQTAFHRYVLWGLIGLNPQIISKKHKYIFCDMPYHGRMDTSVQDQMTENDWNQTFWRWCKDGLHDNRMLDVPGDRFEQWGVKVKPWEKADGGHILICPSSNTMTNFMHGMDASTWAHKVAEELQKHTKRFIKIRHKPRKGGLSGPSVAEQPIEQDLRNCHAVITSASLTAIDALTFGVPVFSTHSWCPAAWCSEKDLSKIETPNYNDREMLFNNLAYKQYSIEEMKNGTCFEMTQRYLK